MIPFLVTPPLTQGTESSDLSLISDFFPTPRTILEISVNLKRNFSKRVGVWVLGLNDPKKALECTICSPRIQKFSGGGPPDPPTTYHVLLSSFKDPHPYPIQLGITHYSDLFAKTHSDPCNSTNLTTPPKRQIPGGIPLF